MEKIKNITFKGRRIIMTSSEGKVYSRSLGSFPVLLDAMPYERKKWNISPSGDDVRWPELDENIHINSFLSNSETDTPNEIAEIFAKFPELNVSGIAALMGMNKSLLAKYIYGIKNPSKKRVEQVRDTLRSLGERLMAI